MTQASLSDRVWALFDAGREDDAVRLLEDGCGAGDADALFMLATWYLSGQSVRRDLGEAAALLRAAVTAGHADAALMQVALTANGAFGPAETDDVAARHCALLEAMALNKDGNPTALATPERLSDTPFVQFYRGLVTAEDCAHIISVAEPLMEPSFVVDPANGRHMANPVRTSDGTVIGPAREDLVIRAINKRLAAASSTDVLQGETLSVLRYAPGQQYRMHMDAMPSTPNQRIKTMIVYLNDGYAGGETMFESNGLKVAGRTGDVVLFDNVLPDGRADPASRHAGLPVTSGIKRIATRWIRAQPYDPWNYRPGE